MGSIWFSGCPHCGWVQRAPASGVLPPEIDPVPRLLSGLTPSSWNRLQSRLAESGHQSVGGSGAGPVTPCCHARQAPAFQEQPPK